MVEFHQRYPHPNSARLAHFYADHDREPEIALKQAREAWHVYKNVGVADTLAWCLLKSGNAEEAASKIREAMRWKTPDAEILFHAGMIELALGHSESGRTNLKAALDLNPCFHLVHATTAAALLQAQAPQSGR